MNAEDPLADSHVDLAGSWVVVTGAGGLIGRAVVHEVVAAGARVIGIDRSPESLNAVEAYAEDSVKVMRADVTQPSSVSEVLEAVEAARSKHLVHAAGWQVPDGRDRVPDADEWRSVIDVHVIGPALLTTRLLEAIHTRGESGSVVFLSSVHEGVVYGDPSYGAAKAGIAGVVRELAALAADHGSRVNAVAPGHVSDQDLPSPPSRLGRRSIPPRSVAKAVRFLLCGHCSPHTTGATLTVDAGFRLNDLWAWGQGGRRRWPWT